MKERTEFDEKQAYAKAEKEEAGEVFVPDPREWPLIEKKLAKTKKIHYVVCLNTMG